MHTAYMNYEKVFSFIKLVTSKITTTHNLTSPLGSHLANITLMKENKLKKKKVPEESFTEASHDKETETHLTIHQNSQNSASHQSKNEGKKQEMWIVLPAADTDQACAFGS